MAATLDLASLSPEPTTFTIGVLERNHSVRTRAARVIRAATNLEWVAAEEDPELLRVQLAPSTRLLACEAGDAELVLGWMATAFPRAHLIAWGHDARQLVELAERDERVVSLLGWPAYESMPRSWELAVAARAMLAGGPDPTTLGQILVGSPVVAQFAPATPDDREALLVEVRRLAERVGANDRVCARIVEVAHELVMNATFDAPINRAGEPRYAHDRRAAVELEPAEVPMVQFASDGLLIVLQVTDPFGRLTRDDVLTSVRRGTRAASEAATEVVDSSRGGAGLGLWRVYGSSAVTIVDVVPGHSTMLTSIFDIDLNPRETRSLPPSLHLFDRGRL